MTSAGFGAQSLSLLVWYLSLGPLVIVHSGPGCENLVRRVVGAWIAQKAGADWPGPQSWIKIALKQHHHPKAHRLQEMTGFPF